jgi:hypothetical protein
MAATIQMPAEVPPSPPSFVPVAGASDPVVASGVGLAEAEGDAAEVVAVAGTAVDVGGIVVAVGGTLVAVAAAVAAAPVTMTRPDMPG